MTNDRHRKIQTSLGEKISNVILYVLLAVLAIITLYPFWNVFVLVLNEPLDIRGCRVYITKAPQTNRSTNASAPAPAPTLYNRTYVRVKLIIDNG